MALKLKKLNEQVVVITGASSGIGLATAERAAEYGAKLVLAARSKQTLDSIVDSLAEHGCQAIAVECDVSDRAQVEQVATAAISHFGQLNTWVNNAGQGLYGRIDTVSEEDSFNRASHCVSCGETVLSLVSKHRYYNPITSTPGCSTTARLHWIAIGNRFSLRR